VFDPSRTASSPTVTLRPSDTLRSPERPLREPRKAPECPILGTPTVLQRTLRSPITISVTVGLIPNPVVYFEPWTRSEVLRNLSPAG
jgi:hypothetical protein